MAHLDESNWDPEKSLRFFVAKKMEGRIKPQCSIRTLQKDVIFGSVFFEAPILCSKAFYCTAYIHPVTLLFGGGAESRHAISLVACLEADASLYASNVRQFMLEKHRELELLSCQNKIF